MPSVPDKIQGVYREDSTTTTYHSRWVNELTARTAVLRIGSYNDFRADAVKQAIKSIAAKNPNALYSIGREGSPVIYVQTYKPQTVIGVFSSMPVHRRADEIDKVTGGPRASSYLERLNKTQSGASVVRAWWD